MLLCDFHIHTTYSDGSIELQKVVDIYGQAGFDVIAITDHVVNNDSSIGKLAHRFKYTVKEENFQEYMDAIEFESTRAWDKYGMLVISGIEISKNYINPDLSAHILLLDLKEFISASWDYERIFREARNRMPYSRLPSSRLVRHE